MIRDEFDIPEAELIDTNYIVPNYREPLHCVECEKCGAIYLSHDIGSFGKCYNCK